MANLNFDTTVTGWATNSGTSTAVPSSISKAQFESMLTALTPQTDFFDRSIVINESGNANYDFRVESDTNTHALHVDASTGNVGIGGSPDATDYDLKVHGQMRVDNTTGSTEMFVHSSTDNSLIHAKSSFATGIGQLYSEGGGGASVDLGDMNASVNNDRFSILNADDKVTFTVKDSSNASSIIDAIEIDNATGNVAIGGATDATYSLKVHNDMWVTGNLRIGDSAGDWISIGEFTSADTQINAAVRAASPAVGSTNGGILTGDPSGHMVVAIKGNDVRDSFSVLTGIGIVSTGAATGATGAQTIAVEALSTEIPVGTLILNGTRTITLTTVASIGDTTLTGTFADPDGNGPIPSGVTLHTYGVYESRLKVTSGETVINEIGVNHDFRVESISTSNMLVVDASANQVGIGLDPSAHSGYELVVSGSQLIQGNGGPGNTELLINDTSGTSKLVMYGAGGSQMVMQDATSSTNIMQSFRIRNVEGDILLETPDNTQSAALRTFGRWLRARDGANATDATYFAGSTHSSVSGNSTTQKVGSQLIVGGTHSGHTAYHQNGTAPATLIVTNNETSAQNNTSLNGVGVLIENVLPWTATTDSRDNSNLILKGEGAAVQQWYDTARGSVSGSEDAVNIHLAGGKFSIGAPLVAGAGATSNVHDNILAIDIDSGSIAQRVLSSAPADALLANNQVTFYLDGSTLKAKSRNSSGTVATHTLS